ncbi:hypothetical protein [Mesoterricola sediminis]|uniref:Uncharacterized protein n=1 Tax=Mesoterricola sediminis TaxID=2927980 RepID=A0AA48KBW7_9BACT|nr:hypothetical protein [Mesoterricola sediminis]BDU76326.1 hypothetical protein METESE_12840 [Mesoterricola sediminis]
MRALPAILALSTVLAAPLKAEAPKFIKVDITSKTMIQKDNPDGPSEVHIRVPVSLAKGVLEMAGDKNVKVNHKHVRDIKVDELLRLLENARPGDLLLEITTDKGDLVKITVQ